jgi:hypothetical protein
METTTLTPEEQGIKNTAEKILNTRGKKLEHSYYQPPISVGGDFYVNLTRQMFRKNGITITGYKRIFDDGSGSYSLAIFDVGRGIFKRFLHSLGMYDGKLVFSLEHHRTSVIDVFERGAWQKQLESLVTQN